MLKLVRSYLRAGVMADGVVVENEEGTPQGGPLSPLLSNIVLDELDKELERRGHRFCRYADDCNIYVKTERAGKRVMESVAWFLETKLKLRVNRSKSAVARPETRKFLGMRIVGGVLTRLEVAPTSVERLLEKVRNLTRRSRGVRFEQVVADLRRLTDGWVGYFCVAETPALFERLDQRIRPRLRAYLWHLWKTPRNRGRQLVRLGIRRTCAWSTAHSSKGAYHLARCFALCCGLSNAYLAQAGYSSLHARYLALTS
jgi:RNA-directed DNA polymerase